MTTTLHLFRNDVRRLRWWLLGWGIFWAGMLAMSGDIPAGPANLTEAFLRHTRSPLSPVLLANVLHAALLIVLVTLLMIPHGPADPRLFWRTRPVAPRDVLRAKALFIGLFLLAYPVASEVVFWLGWLPVRDTLAFVPSMLGERLAWSAGVTALVVLGERDARRYQFAVLGVLALGLVWTHAGDQFHLRWVEVAWNSSHFPPLHAEGLLPQLVEFVSKGPTVATDWPTWLKWIPAVSVGVGGWLVVGCRYLAPGWRATRIAGLLALLVALVAGHVGVHYERRIERWLSSVLNRSIEAETATELVTVENPEDPHLRLPMNAQAAALNVELRRVVMLGNATPWADSSGHDFGDGKVMPVWVKPQWNIATTPTGMVALMVLRDLRPVAVTNNTSLRADGGWISLEEIALIARRATNQLIAALPELAGYRLVSDASPRGGLYMNPKVTATLERVAQAVTVDFDVVLIEVETAVNVPLRSGSSARVGQMRLNVRSGSTVQNQSTGRRLVTRQPWQPWHDRRYSSLHRHEEPDLFIFRNAATKEAFTIDESDVYHVHLGLQHTAPLLSPARQHSFAVWDRPLTSSYAGVERRIFTEAWLDHAEVLGVRLKLVGRSQRTQRLENFQLMQQKAEAARTGNKELF